jgi:hypothetical protein
MLKPIREFFQIVPKEMFAALSGIFGYLGSMLFMAIASVAPRAGQPGHAVAVFLADFEVDAFLYLMYIHPMFIGAGWAVIFIFGYFRKRLAVIAAATGCAIFAYFSTTKELQRSITLVDLQEGIEDYFNMKSDGFAVHTIPFVIYFGVLLALTFRKKPK